MLPVKERCPRFFLMDDPLARLRHANDRLLAEQKTLKETVGTLQQENRRLKRNQKERDQSRRTWQHERHRLKAIERACHRFFNKAKSKRGIVMDDLHKLKVCLDDHKK